MIAYIEVEPGVVVACIVKGEFEVVQVLVDDLVVVDLLFVFVLTLLLLHQLYNI